MVWKEYEYAPRIDKHGQHIYRPMLRVEVSAGTEAPQSFTALVDSGTEVTIMSAEIADYFGISPIGPQWGRIDGLGGTKAAFQGAVNICVPEFPSEVITTSVVFVDSVSRDLSFDILLGQDDFFRRFFVRFERSRNKFYLKVA